MNEMQRANPYQYGAGELSQAERNRVLRNTYWLLALSLIPTVAGAWLGITLNFGQVMARSPGTALIVFMVGAFGLIFAIQRFRNSALGVGLLLAFTFFMGLMLSRLLAYVLGFSNGVTLITMAFGGTAVIFFVMATIATVSKRDFSGLGKWLTVGAVILIVACLANFFFQIPALFLTISTLAIVIFSAFMLYDVQRVVNGGETNYVSATLAIYLDLYNVFQNLLMLLGIFGGNRD
ncbi:MAG: Bax inhibitor-1/YccA family protein [Burkholderiaceae bacterium]|jgi:modulator of FtsH protease